VGGDASSDIAVIKAELNGALVTPMEIGDSSELVVGDWVMTLGSPLGLEQSVSSGIVSALYRNQLMADTSGTTLYTNLIQVDAAINGGNSGGALVNEKGQLVGINSLLADAGGTGSFSGIGFAIPGNYAVDIANKVINGEKVTHAYIGLSCATVNEQNAQANHLSTDHGAYVAELAQGGPAEAAGIQVGDIITRIADQDVTSADSLLLAVRSQSVGDTVDVTLVRNGQEQTVKVKLGSDEALQAAQEEQQRQQAEEQQRQEELQRQQLEQYLQQFQNQRGQSQTFIW
jgi:putative serine protease PepD